ncbi:hypothetical protein AC629_41395 [Bradyrhizobium sp. NAS80.1]|uniref:DUF1515 family protein n=1 Tax=Bradyrhizobium sp. NAS80.1 TaxID=1680159 RepID=UPI000968ABEA|nr:DUF1515 family protein [Bradyrhizobium sp. NAS80.1]OKO69292.1 hypothetical protein AC629_41395 [Bradyrhizobium sp. NAS80.1]
MTEAESIQAALRDFARTLGGLETTVKSLTSQWRDQDEKASLGRRDMHQKIDAMRDDVRKLEGLVGTAIADIAIMKPIVDGVLEARQQIAGAAKAGRWIYWVMSGGGGAFALYVASHFFSVTLK